MESSIAAFLMRWLACELLPTNNNLHARATLVVQLRAETTSVFAPHVSLLPCAQSPMDFGSISLIERSQRLTACIFIVHGLLGLAWLMTTRSDINVNADGQPILYHARN